MEYRLIRTLTCYSNSDERIVFDVQLEKFDLAGFQKEFGIEENNPMYDSYEVKAKNVPFTKLFVPSSIGINWDFNDYAYFIEAIEN